MKKIVLIPALLGLIAFTSCVNKETDAEEKEPTETIKERVRPAASGGTTAAYFEYRNTSQKTDTLVSIQADFAGMAQVHESYETEDGMMGMREQKEIVIKPGEDIVFKQGGLHVMLMNVSQDLVEGDSVTVLLEFSGAGRISKKLPVTP